MNRTDKRGNNIAYGYKALIFFIFSLIFSPAGAQAPAFPGAEGHGRYVTGGRGGTVIHVTNLNDSGTGSFRAAVNGSSKKIVVFDVGGVIALNSDVKIGANTTILGQTAPAPGITLRYYTVQPGANNIIRFIRCRRGQEKNINDGADAIWNRQLTGVIIDHCSFSWSIDEVASFYDNNNFTMQWCTIGESLNNAGHGKGAHGYGGIWGGKLASFHHNLICHVNNRSPRFNGARYNWTGYTSNKLYSQYNWQNAVQAENVDFRNCVVYNCGNGCYGGPGGGQINMVGNYYKNGPAGSTSKITTASVANSTSANGYQIYWDMFSRYYISGNQLNAMQNAGWDKVAFDSGTKTMNGIHYTPDPNHYYGNDVTYVNIDGTDCVSMKLDEPCPTGEVTTHTAATAFDKVLGYAGASLTPDDVDQRYATEARNGTATYSGSVTKKAGRIDLVSDVNGYTEANFGTGSRDADFDADQDGIADAWEQANGGDLTANGYDLDPTGYYTNIEVYANSLVQDIMLAGNSDAKDAAKEYYPKYTKTDGTKVGVVNTLGLNLGDIITFADATVKTVCVANWDTNGDGELSFSEAEAVTDLGTVFRGNGNIKSFNELQYFTGLTSISNQAFLNCTAMTTIKLPSSVTSIGSAAFAGCSYLKSIDIPSGVTSIGEFAFKQCIFMTAINIPNSVTTIGEAAFDDCRSLTSINIPNSVNFIGGLAFAECDGLKSITIPSSVKTIGSSPFYYSKNLTSVVVDSKNTVYDSRDNCNAIIQKSSNMLIAGCKTTIIPSSVTSIRYNAFDGCLGLTAIAIPAGVTTIGNEAFCRCANLTSVTVENATPVAISKDVFTNRTNATLYVPKGSKAAYEAADYWKEFKEIVEYGAADNIETTDISQLTDAIYIEPIIGRIGGDVSIEVKLKNAEAATAYVFDLVLPEGITVAKNENGKYIDALSDRHDDHSRTFNDKGNNTYSLSTLSGNSEALTGNDGAIRLLTLHIDEALAEGTYAIDIKNAQYSTPNGQLLELPDTRTAITVESYILGDVNGNSKVDIGDAVSIVNHMVGKQSETFIEKAADTNKNGKIDIGDAVTIVNYMVGKTTTLSRTIDNVWDEKEPQ